LRQTGFPFLPKDFIETEDGLIFAVVSYHSHDQKVGCFLRYVQDQHGWHKVDTEQANRLLERHHPEFLFYSSQFDAAFHAVPVNSIIHHHRPEQRLQQLLKQPAEDPLQHKLHKLIAILQQYSVDIDAMGLTGSMLINQQKATSDIDLVIYGREAFHQCRSAVKKAIADNLLQKLDITQMQENYQRRDSELDFDTFSWHEYRKCNKAMIDGSKFDIGMVCLSDELDIEHRHFLKQGIKTIQCRVTDDSRAFDFPARYRVDNALTPEIISFTHTYVGQVEKGEFIEVCGALECDASGTCRIVVGSTREARGEYIKVIEQK
jgi:predicted nucleotidyltransferase|tara:strand:+ start:1089 stop:2045 length:957 start_codon:yes stop_codon:yes gene_type:complete